MKRGLGILAGILPAALLAATASPALAIDIHNCTPSNIRVVFFNERDMLELTGKKRIRIPAGSSLTNVAIPGRRTTHKVKIYDASKGNRYLATYGSVDSNLGYVVFYGPDGKIAMVTGAGCS